MYEDNNDRNSGFSRENFNEKIRPYESRPRARWIIPALILLALLVIILASTTTYLFINRQVKSPLSQAPTPTSQFFPKTTSTPVATPTPVAAPTIVNITPTASTANMTINENIHLTCISWCDNHIDATLNNVVLDEINSRMEWHFTIKNVSNSVYSSVRAELYLEDPDGMHYEGGQPGTLTEEGNPMTPGQTLQEYATFLFLPVKSVPYTLHITIYPLFHGSDYQTEIFTF